jgi:hypothetical protein
MDAAAVEPEMVTLVPVITLVIAVLTPVIPADLFYKKKLNNMKKQTNPSAASRKLSLNKKNDFKSAAIGDE